MRMHSISRTRMLLLAAAAFGAALYGYGLGGPPLVDYDEAAYARLVETTFESGQRVVFTVDGYDWFDKPPLYLWMLMASRILIADPELAFRLPGMLMGLASAFVCYAIVRAVSGSRGAGALALVALLTMPGYVEAARTVGFDVPLVFASLLCAYAAVRAMHDGQRERQWLGISGACFGAALMIKSAMGLFAPLVAAAFVLGAGRGDMLHPRKWVSPAIGAALVALPWHAVVTAVHGGSFWQTYLGVHVRDRFATDLFHNDAGNFIYAAYLADFGFPWVFVAGVLGSIVALGRSAQLAARRTTLYLLAASALLLAVFGIAETKVLRYLVPLFPLAALLIGMGAAALGTEMLDRISGWRRAAAAALITVLAIAGTARSVTHGYRAAGAFSYDQALAYDGRHIGTLLDESGAPSVALLGSAYWESVRYYGSIAGAPLADATLPPGAYGLVWNDDPQALASLKGTEVLFAGEYLTLVRGRAAATD